MLWSASAPPRCFGQIRPARRRDLLSRRAQPLGGLAPSGAAGMVRPAGVAADRAAPARAGGDAPARQWRRRACEVPLEPHGRLPHVPRLPGRRKRLRLLLNAEPLPRPMLDVHEAEGRAAALIDAALKAGADAADVLYIGDASTEVQVRLGELEDVDSLGRRGDRPAFLRRPPLGERLLLRSFGRRARRSGRARRGDGARGARGPLGGPRARTTGCCAAPRPTSRATTAPIPPRSRSRRGRSRSRNARAPSPESPIPKAPG